MKNTIDLYYIHLYNDFSGSPRVLKDAIESTKSTPENTYLFTSQHGGFLDKIKGIKVKVSYFRSNNKYMQLVLFFLTQLLLFIKLSGYLIRGNFNKRQATIVINTMLPFTAAIAGKLFGAKVVYYVHETHLKPELFKSLLRFFIENFSSHVIFVSDYLRVKEKFVKPSQFVIHNGLRSDFAVSSDVKKQLKYDGKILFFAGSLKWYKGIDQLLALATKMTDFKFIAALNCENYEFEKFLEGITCPPNVQFLVRPTNIQDFYEDSFMVLNLSLVNGWIETFGLSLIEGMAYGSPVIAPPIGGPVEFVNNDNGFLVDSREIDKIVNIIQSVNSSFELWERYSDNAKLTSKKFTNTSYKNKFSRFLVDNNLV